MITLKSHGFKYARPEANFVFDVSYFKNPWRDENIRNEKDTELRRMMVVKFMKEQKGCLEFVVHLALMLRHLNNQFPDESIQVALCCSAGEYRSPALVEMLGEVLQEYGVNYQISHSTQSKI
jgi:RNase adaptor protein for sRNA GlmZ degradation